MSKNGPDIGDVLVTGAMVVVGLSVIGAVANALQPQVAGSGQLPKKSKRQEEDEASLKRERNEQIEARQRSDLAALEVAEENGVDVCRGCLSVQPTRCPYCNVCTNCEGGDGFGCIGCEDID